MSTTMVDLYDDRIREARAQRGQALDLLRVGSTPATQSRLMQIMSDYRINCERASWIERHWLSKLEWAARTFHDQPAGKIMALIGW